MKDQFVTFEIAKKLKELGFNEECLYAWCEEGGWNKYSQKREEISFILKTDGNPFGTFYSGKNWNKRGNNKNKISCSAPLWQQVIDWFRVKHEIDIVYNHVNAEWEIWKHSNKLSGINCDIFILAKEQAILKAIEIITK